MAQYTAFSYKPGKSFLHLCPAWCKILALPILNVLIFKLPFYFSLFFVIIQTFFEFFLRFSIKEQFADVKPIIFYALLLLFAKITGQIFSGNISFKNFFSDFYHFFLSEKDTFILLLKLFCLMQLASLVFKTSTSLQLREGFESIELYIRKIFHLKAKAPLAELLSLFVAFIPQVARNWNQATSAWYARGGKKNLRMLLVLLPVFFSVGMKGAYNSARAISIRKKLS